MGRSKSVKAVWPTSNDPTAPSPANSRAATKTSSCPGSEDVVMIRELVDKRMLRIDQQGPGAHLDCSSS